VDVAFRSSWDDGRDVLIDFLAIAWPRMRAIAWISPFDYYPASDPRRHRLGGKSPRAVVRHVLLWASHWVQRRDL
jgi:hypothetical protein